MAKIRINYEDSEIVVLNKINAALHEEAVERALTRAAQFVVVAEGADGFLGLEVRRRDTDEGPVQL